MTAPVPLEYVSEQNRPRGARWWLWALAAGVLGLGFIVFFVPIKIGGRTQLARVAAARADIATIQLALDTFKADCGRYPSALEGLAALVTPPAGLQNWHGPYLRRAAAADPWGNPYVYRSATDSSHPASVYSLGPDGKGATRDDVLGAPAASQGARQVQ